MPSFISPIGGTHLFEKNKKNFQNFHFTTLHNEKKRGTGTFDPEFEKVHNLFYNLYLFLTLTEFFTNISGILNNFSNSGLI